jgi:heme/copper-type cytochrome/quinol oxidase subunit 1
MLSGATVIGIFTGIYYYFSAIFGIKYSRVFAVELIECILSGGVM